LIDLTYTRAESDPLIEHLFWIQLVATNRPLGGVDSPYVDPRPNDDALPFYWTLAEDINPLRGNKTDTSYEFFDNSKRPAAGHPDAISWRGELMLASWEDNNAHNVTVYDGLRWGWDMHTVPEPGSLQLLCVALLFAVLSMWRREGAVDRAMRAGGLTNVPCGG
jgi:hypothetical protein